MLLLMGDLNVCVMLAKERENKVSEGKSVDVVPNMWVSQKVPA